MKKITAKALTLYILVGIVVAAAANTIESTSNGIILDPDDGTVDIDGTLNTGQGDYELYAMDQDVETTDSVSFDAVTTDLIQDAGVIDLQPSGDADDYIELSTTANIPFITAKGAALNIDSDSSTIRLRPNADTDDYVYVQTASNVPSIRTAGNSELNVLVNDESDDYIQFYSTGNRPYLKAIGTPQIRFTSNDAASATWIIAHTQDADGDARLQLYADNDFSNNWFEIKNTGDDVELIMDTIDTIRPDTDNAYDFGTAVHAWRNVTAYTLYDKNSGKYTKDYMSKYGKSAVDFMKDIQVKQNGEWDPDTLPHPILAGEGFWQKQVCTGEGLKASCVEDVITDSKAKGDEEAKGYEHHTVIDVGKRTELIDNSIYELIERIEYLEENCVLK